jgi:hypothetical protein
LVAIVDISKRDVGRGKISEQFISTLSSTAISFYTWQPGLAFLLDLDTSAFELSVFLP